MTRTLAYNMEEKDLIPESLTLERLGDGKLPTLRDLLTELLERTNTRIFPTESAEMQHRIWDMALALHAKLLTMDIFKEYDRVTLHRVALDTAMVWEFG